MAKAGQPKASGKKKTREIAYSAMNESNYHKYLHTNVGALRRDRSHELADLITLKSAAKSFKEIIYEALCDKIKTMQEYPPNIPEKKEAHIVAFLTPMFDKFILQFNEKLSEIGYQLCQDVQTNPGEDDSIVGGTMDLCLKVRTNEEKDACIDRFDTFCFIEFKREEPDKGIFQRLGYLEEAIKTSLIQKPVHASFAQMAKPANKDQWLTTYSIIVDVLQTIIFDFFDIENSG